LWADCSWLVQKNNNPKWGSFSIQSIKYAFCENGLNGRHKSEAKRCKPDGR